jgi:3-phenylpropionate/trans-cinnamate dioxygenase ferredoxin component
MTTVRTVAVDSVPLGGLCRLEVDGVAVCLVRTEEDDFYAVDDVCTHEEQSLSEGEIVGCQIECPLHYATFDLRTGEATALPATEPLNTYKVTVADGEIVVDVAATKED